MTDTTDDPWKYVFDCKCERCTAYHVDACPRCRAAVRGSETAEDCPEATHVAPGHETWANPADLSPAQKEPSTGLLAHYEGAPVEVPFVRGRRP